MFLGSSCGGIRLDFLILSSNKFDFRKWTFYEHQQKIFMTSEPTSPRSMRNLVLSFPRFVVKHVQGNFEYFYSFVLFDAEDNIPLCTFHSQEKYFSPKRSKPSLSIVNPLDVLRQRVMLEMARRQRESANKQVNNKTKCHKHLHMSLLHSRRNRELATTLSWNYLIKIIGFESSRHRLWCGQICL